MNSESGRTLRSYRYLQRGGGGGENGIFEKHNTEDIHHALELRLVRYLRHRNGDEPEAHLKAAGSVD